jgi:hypothetical protein
VHHSNAKKSLNNSNKAINLHASPSNGSLVNGIEVGRAKLRAINGHHLRNAIPTIAIRLYRFTTFNNLRLICPEKVVLSHTYCTITSIIVDRLWLPSWNGMHILKALSLYLCKHWCHWYIQQEGNLGEIFEGCWTTMAHPSVTPPLGEIRNRIMIISSVNTHRFTNPLYTWNQAWNLPLVERLRHNSQLRFLFPRFWYHGLKY